MFLLNVLGSLSLQSDGAPAPAGVLQKRRLGLLAILGVAGERGISRDRIQSYLWPESDSDRARHALDQLVYATRRALTADPFIAEGGDLKLDRAVIDTDIGRFTDAIREERLEDAVELYGGRLLAGISIADSRDLETWLDSEASRIEQSYQKSLDTLAQQACRAGDHARAVEWRRKLYISDPLSARLALGLAQSLVESGDTPGAIQHARAYQDLVRSQLEVEPDLKIQAFVDSISTPPAKQRARHAPADAGVVSTASASQQTRPESRLWLLGFSIPLILIIALALAAGKTSNNPAASHTAARAAYLRGVNAFRKAVDLDPSYAEAHSGLANAYVMIGYSGYRPGNAMFPKAKAAALDAIQIDSTLAAPYAALGMELTWERDFESAARAFQKSISLDPKYATAHQWYGILLRILGDIPGSVRETGRAAELDPLSLQIQNNYATFLANAGKRDEALEHYIKMVEQEPDSSWVNRNPWLLTNMSSVYASAGRYSEALRFAERAVEILPGHPRAMSALASVYRRMGKPGLARSVMDQSDRNNPHYSAYRAMFFAAEAQPDSAFAWFDRVDDWGIPVLISLRGLDRIKSDPRYDALLARLGMKQPDR
jgi:DNA-binding SARP family transcriptional activator/Tfp pilus assembly protein PilF